LHATARYKGALPLIKDIAEKGVAMTIQQTLAGDRILRFTTDIVSSYLRKNTVPVSEIPEIVEVIHQKITALYPDVSTNNLQQDPAISVSESITPDHIICLEDGKKFKMLKKHLRTQYNMSPEDYRMKWSLPLDYPMVAPNYAVKRQELAKASGLGKPRRSAET